MAHVATCMPIGDWFLLRQISKVGNIGLNMELDLQGRKRRVKYGVRSPR